MLKFMLETKGYRVHSASNGQDAIGIFAEKQMDLVLVNSSMPHMSGNQLVERLKRIGPQIPMILLGDTHGADAHAADALLSKKNCTSQELLERIKIMSARKRGPRKGSPRLAPVELAAAS